MLENKERVSRVVGRLGTCSEQQKTSEDSDTKIVC